MGCGAAKGQPPAKARPGKDAKTPLFADKKKNLDPKDFLISSRTGEVIVKQAGSIGGEQFNIEECKGCDIFLLDHLACAFIDYCEDCRIFVGPVESSVMLRNCTSCSLVIACQQFRSRDCQDCRTALMCATEPIIETSANMQFACFDFMYFSLRDQLARAGLRLWNNKWWQVYDFNKDMDRPNWGLLPQEEVNSLLRVEACNSLTPEEVAMDRVVPVTLGSRQRPSQESCFLLFLPGAEPHIEAFLGQVAKLPHLALCRTRSTKLPDDRLKSLLAWSKEKLEKILKGKELVGIEVCGPGVFEEVQGMLSGTGLAAGSKCIRVVPQAQTPTLAKAFFEVWKDEI